LRPYNHLLQTCINTGPLSNAIEVGRVLPAPPCITKKLVYIVTQFDGQTLSQNKNACLQYLQDLILPTT